MFDPGFDTWSLRRWLESAGLGLAAILNTHGHADHIAGNRHHEGGLPGSASDIGRNEAFLLRDPEANMSGPSGSRSSAPSPTAWSPTASGSSSRGSNWKSARYPATAPARSCSSATSSTHISSRAATSSFQARSVAPTWAETSELLARGIHAKLFTLPDSTVIYPGHGPPTTIGTEKRSNPFVGAASGCIIRSDRGQALLVQCGIAQAAVAGSHGWKAAQPALAPHRLSTRLDESSWSVRPECSRRLAPFLVGPCREG